MKYRFIMEHRKEFRLGKMCKVLEVSRSGYHNYVRGKGRQRRLENQHLAEVIRTIFSEYRGVYGSPRVYQELRRRGIICNRKRVVRLMRVEGLRAKARKKFKFTTNSDHSYPVAGNVLERRFNFQEVNQAWVSDITFISTKEGWLYLACILDLCSRMIVGWSMGISLKACLVIGALQQAINKRGENPGLIFHSDRGSQYAAYEVRTFLENYNIIQSMSRKGNCYDNAVMESFFHTLKTELVPLKFETRQEAQLAVFDYIEIFYNRQRSHSSIGYLSPFEYENLLRHKSVA